MNVKWGQATLVTRRMLPDGTILPEGAVAWNLLQPGVYVVGLESGNWCVVRAEGTEHLVDFGAGAFWANQQVSCVQADEVRSVWVPVEEEDFSKELYQFDEDFQHGWTWPTKIEAEAAFATWLLTHQGD